MSSPGEAYTKVAGDMVYSSVWEEDGDTCKIWMTFLCLKDKNGIVSKNITGISRIAKISLEKCEEAVRKFESPDPRSSSQEHEGRRILPLPGGGWKVVNHEKYQAYGWSDDKKAYESKRKAEWRQRKSREAFEAESAPLPAKGPVPIVGGRPIDEAPNGPTREMAVAWGAMVRETAAADFTEAEVVEAWLYFQSNGWKRSERGPRIVDYRTALEGRIRDRRAWREQNERKTPASGQRGSGEGRAASDGKSEETGRSLGTFNQGTSQFYRGRELRPPPSAAAAQGPDPDSSQPV